MKKIKVTYSTERQGGPDGPEIIQEMELDHIIGCKLVFMPEDLFADGTKVDHKEFPPAIMSIDVRAINIKSIELIDN